MNFPIRYALLLFILATPMLANEASSIGGVSVTLDPQTPLPQTPGHHKLKAIAKGTGYEFELPYLLYLPKDYDKTNDPRPLLIFLHGAGECGNDLNAIYSHGPAAQLRDREDFRNGYPFIGLYPQCFNRRWDTPGSAAAVIALLDQISARMRVDKNRVYCTGLSMGGKGTWMVAQEAPDRFAAIAPISAVAVQPDTAGKTLKNVAEWIICGANDGDYTVGSKAMYTALHDAGGETYLTLYPNEGHGVWTRYYSDLRFYEWLGKHTRKNLAIGAPPEALTPGFVSMSRTAPNNGGVGSILCEYWRSLPGTAVDDLRNSPDFPASPTERGYINRFEIPGEQDDNYGTAVRGYVHPPKSGNYTFWIASDDTSELWLSTSEKTENKAKIALVSSWAPSLGFESRPEQKSKPINLEAGKKYYIEALQKEGGGGDNLAVGWTFPDGTHERPIPGSRLSPATPLPPSPPPAAKLLDTKLPQVPGIHKLRAEITIGGKAMPMSYVIYLPKGYDKTKDPQPLVMFLHGNTHQGSDWTGILNEGPPQYLNDDPKLREIFPLIGFFPQCPAGRRWEDRQIVKATVALLDEVIKQFRVDKDRVYCTGLSMGGQGTWDVGEEAPDRFAALATISAPEVHPEIAVKAFREVPTWIICGANDNGFTEGSKRMYNALKQAGCESELTVVPNEGHGVWGRYYPDIKFYEWLLKHRRGVKKN